MAYIHPSLLDVYRRADLTFVRGEGAYLYTDKGEKFLDFTSGIAVNCLGHCHPKLVSALQEQATKLWHTSNLFRVEGQEKLADRLTSLTFADRVFFNNSGAEALETAIKTARRYHWVRGDKARNRILSFPNAFHGRTIADLAAAGARGDMGGFGPAPEGFDQVEEFTIDAVRSALSDETAAILLEPVQGEGGINVFPNDFLREIRKICDETGSLLIYDEVQCGVGRTGKLFAYEWSGATPDIMAVAKGIGGGFPLGACLASENAAAGMDPGAHGSTFGGNPLAMAVGLAVLDEVARPEFLAHVVEMGEYLSAALNDLSSRRSNVFSGERGLGLMRGLVCNMPAADMLAAARNHHALFPRAKGDVVRLLPPLNIEKTHVDEAVAALDSAAGDVAS
ncbi:MAG: aspartate aminotransferase family protein [Parvularculaceae bacterium]